MKKKLIAVGAASLAAAAMPMVGVFATDPTTSDTVTVTIPFGCTVNDGARTTKTAAFGSVAPGANGVAQSTTAMTVSCNKAWLVTPSTDGLAASNATTITSGIENSKGSQFWVKLTAGNTDNTNGGSINNPFSSPHAIDGSAITGTASALDLTFTPEYTIHIGNNQEEGSYTGTVTYTIALGA